MPLPITIDKDKVADFCRKHHVQRLALFGSVLREDFRPDSDVDVLIEFEPGKTPGYFKLMRMEIEFSALIGREADFRTREDLSAIFRDDVLRSAQTQYAA